jgi:hypothetical protein
MGSKALDVGSLRSGSHHVPDRCSEPKRHADIGSKLNLLMVSFARRRGDAAEFVDGVEQGNESFVFRLSVVLARWTTSHCEALAIGSRLKLPLDDGIHLLAPPL